jgi:hypothetical protein
VSNKPNEFLKHELTELEKKKGRIANILAILVIVAACFIAAGFLTGNIMLVIALAAINVLFGPVTLFFYLREVKKGIFKAGVEADIAEESTDG